MRSIYTCSAVKRTSDVQRAFQCPELEVDNISSHLSFLTGDPKIAIALYWGCMGITQLIISRRL